MRTIMLDVDGVLVCGRPRDGAPWWTDLGVDLGISRDALRSAFFAPRWQDIVSGRKPLVPELAEVLAEIAPDVGVDAFIDYWFVNDSRIDNAVLDAVSEIRRRGDRVYLATNQEHMRAAYLMEDMGLREKVDGIFYSAALGYQKPSPEFYSLVTQATSVAPESIVLIDDTEENVQAARASGWSAVHWQKGVSLAGALAL